MFRDGDVPGWGGGVDKESIVGQPMSWGKFAILDFDRATAINPATLGLIAIVRYSSPPTCNSCDDKVLPTRNPRIVSGVRQRVRCGNDPT